MIGWWMMFGVSAQTKQKFFVKSITIQGNKKTKEKTLIRELNFVVGDSLEQKDLTTIFDKNRLLLLNTTMVTDAKFNITSFDNQNIDIIISVKENWYIYPWLYLSLADRNFNVWWKEKKHDFSRVNVTGRLSWRNVTGINDNFKANLQIGFTRKMEFTYTAPAIGRTKNFGFFSNVLYSTQKEVWYNTQRDSLQFFRDEDQSLLHRFRTHVGFIYRPKIRAKHRFRLEYNNNTIGNKIIQNENPFYFGENQTQQKYFAVEYQYTFDHRDVKPYPEKGSFLNVTIEKDGILRSDNTNALYLNMLIGKYVSFSKKWSAEFIGKGQYEFTRRRQPYYDMRALGYGTDYLRGYEYYVVDGTDYAYLKTSLRYQFYNKKIDFGDFMPESVRYIPFRAYFSINNDVGRVQNLYTDPSNSLPNRWLWGKGIGLDLVFFYSNVLQIEYSMNHLNKGGVYLHLKTPLE